jgi:dihydropyrimidinase
MGERNAHVDFSIHLGLVRWDQLTNLQKYMNEYGVTSFKFYAAYRGEEAKAIGMLGNETDDAFLLEGFSAVAKFPGAVACIHAENIEIILRLMKKFREEGRDGLRVWSECRPNLSEAETVYRAIAFAGASGCPLYVVHLSARESLEEVNRARLRGQKVFVETCPQYLTLTMDSPIGLIGKVNPPLRSSEDIDALWKAISEGSVDTIGTDHCAPLREVKSGSIWEARPGFPGSATMLPILLSEGLHKRGIPLERIAELTSYNAARIFNLYPRKGTIQVGSDADLCIVDLNLVKKVEAKRLHSRSDFSVHEGWTLKGWPVLTMVRGKVVMRDGEIVGPRGHGRFIEPCFM